MKRRWLAWLAVELYRGLLFAYLAVFLAICIILAVAGEIDTRLGLILVALAAIMLAGVIFDRLFNR